MCKYFLGVFILFLSSYQVYGQKQSDLYLKVYSIIRYELHFNIDSANKVQKADITLPKVVIRDAVSTPAFPVILFDGKSIEMEKLNSYRLRKIKNIKVVKPDDPLASTLYGSKGAKGLIFITTNNYKFKKVDSALFKDW